MMEDRKFQEMMNFISSSENSDKNPVSLLMEVGAQFREAVTFSFLDDFGLSPQKTFICEVKMGRLASKWQGIGFSKKVAKANAADQVLEYIKKRASELDQGNTTSVTSPPHNVSGPAASLTPTMGSPNSSGIDSPSNPVGRLQELCLKNAWSPPVYDLISEEGESHQKQFIYQCMIESLASQGMGKNKKTAKKLAAENMLSMVQDQDAKSSFVPGAQASPALRSPVKRPTDKCSPGGSSQSGSSSKQRRPLSPPVPFLSSYLYDTSDDMEELNLEDSHPPSTTSTADSVNDEFCTSLRERGDKEGFVVEYHDMSEKGFSGNYQCFVKLNTSPCAVCCGTGPTKGLSHDNAAKNAILYLNTVSS